MMSNKAWQRHGCYKLGSVQYFNWPLESSVLGCYDDWNSLDHFDPTTDMRRLMKQFLYLRSTYSALQDGWDLVQRGNWTFDIQRPGSNGTVSEIGLYSVSRAGIQGVQNFTGNYTDQVWLLYSNMNATNTWAFDCLSSLWISSPYQSGTTVQNLLAPFEQYTLEVSGSSYYNNGAAPWYGCLSNITMDPYGMKVLVPTTEWVPPLPMLTRFLPGHDARITALPGDPNSTTINIVLEFDTTMLCTSVTNSISFNMSSSGIGGPPTLDANSVACNPVTNPVITGVVGAPPSAFSWSATLTNVPDGILDIIVNNPSSSAGTSTGVSPCSGNQERQNHEPAFDRSSTTCFCARALQTILWCSLTRTTTTARSNTQMVSTRSRTKHSERTCLGTLAISDKAGRIGQTGKT